MMKAITYPVRFDVVGGAFPKVFIKDAADQIIMWKELPQADWFRYSGTPIEKAAQAMEDRVQLSYNMVTIAQAMNAFDCEQ